MALRESGISHLKAAVPAATCTAIAGTSNETLNELQAQSATRIHMGAVVSSGSPGSANDFSEQVVSITGALESIGTALRLMAEIIGRYSREPWFEAWASHSHCKSSAIGSELYVGKGGGKLKGLECVGVLPQKAPSPAAYLSTPGDARNGSIVTAHADTRLSAAAASAAANLGLISVAAGHSHHEPRVGGDGAARALPAQPPPPPHHIAPEPGGAIGSTRITSMALKMLIEDEEVAVLGQDPTVMRRIQQETNTTGMLAGKVYPGTSLQELTVHGPSLEAVFQAVLLIVTRLGAVMGALRSGGTNVPYGEGRCKILVPKPAAPGLIGPGGATARAVESQCGVRISVDRSSILCTEQVSEQGVLLSGPLSGFHIALRQVVTEVARFAMEPWFNTWVAHSNTGRLIPGLVIFDGIADGVVNGFRSEQGVGTPSQLAPC